MNPITRFLLWCSLTDLTTLNNLPSHKYESSQSSQVMLGTFVLLTGCFALVSGTYAAWLIIGSLYGAILLGLLFAAFIFSIDRAIVGQHNKWTLFPRFLLAIAVALVISVPLELRISQEPIQEAIREEARHYNEDLRRGLNERHGLPRVQKRIAELDELRSEYIRERDRQRLRMEAEETGEVIDGWGSGAPGQGTLYRSAERRMLAAQQKIDETHRELMAVEADEQEIRVAIEREFREQKLSEKQGLAKNIAVLQTVKRDDEVLRYIGWGLKLLFLLFGSTPLLVVLFYHTDYKIL